MFAPTRETDASTQRALTWAAARGIAVRPWPADAPADPLVHQPVLYVVDVDGDPPVPGPLQDWVRLPLDRDEVYARADSLLARASSAGPVLVSLDGDGVLAVDRDLVILSPMETELMAVLVGRLGRITPREDLVAAVWPAGTDPGVLTKHLVNLRRRLADVALVLHTVRGRGVLLDKQPPRAVPPAAAPADDEAAPLAPVLRLAESA